MAAKCLNAPVSFLASDWLHSARKDKVRRSCLRSFDLFSSVQDGIYALGKAHMRSPVSEVSPTLPLERSHFNVLLIGGRGLGCKVTGQCPQTTTSEEKVEPKWGIEPASHAYEPNALPLGQTGSLRGPTDTGSSLMLLQKHFKGTVASLSNGFRISSFRSPSPFPHLTSTVATKWIY